MSSVEGRGIREEDFRALEKKVNREHENKIGAIRRQLMTNDGAGNYKYDRIAHLEARVAKLDEDTAPNYPSNGGGGRKRFRRKTKRTRKTKRKSRRRKSRKTKRRRRRRRKSRR